MIDKNYNINDYDKKFITLYLFLVLIFFANIS